MRLNGCFDTLNVAQVVVPGPRCMGGAGTLPWILRKSKVQGRGAQGRGGGAFQHDADMMRVAAFYSDHHVRGQFRVAARRSVGVAVVCSARHGPQPIVTRRRRCRRALDVARPRRQRRSLESKPTTKDNYINDSGELEPLDAANFSAAGALLWRGKALLAVEETAAVSHHGYCATISSAAARHGR